MKYGKCRKCNKTGWLEKHHIYPQSQFDDEENVVYLCPNCHTDYHVKMGRHKSKNRDFYRSFYMSWIWGIVMVILILCLTQIL